MTRAEADAISQISKVARRVMISDLKLMEMENRIYQAIRYKRLAGVTGLVRELIAHRQH